MTNIRYFNVTPYKGSNGVNDICFGVLDGTTDFPDEVIQIKNEFELFVKLVNTLLKDNTELYDYYYERLFGLADLAFNSKVNQINLAKQSLERMKIELIHEIGPSIRSKLLFSYVKVCIYPFFLMFLIFLGFEFFPPEGSSSFISKLILVAMGAQVGCWLSLAVRTKNINFEDILPILSDQRGIKARVLFVIIFSLSFAVLMKSGLISISLGAFSSATMESDNFSALAAGILMGFSEKIFVEKFESKIQNIKI